MLLRLSRIDVRKTKFMAAAHWRAAVAYLLFCSLVCGQSALQKAVALVQQRNYVEAQHMIAGLAEPTETEQRIAFHRLKAAVASGLGEPKIAVEEMRRALVLAPLEPKLLLATAIAEMQAELLDDALEHANAVGNTAQARAVLGDIEEKRGNYAKAASDYQAALALAPEQETYHVALSMDLIAHQSFPAAIALLKQSTLLFPHSAKLRTLFGIAHYASGFPSDAVAAFEDAIAVDGGFAPAYRCLEEVLLETSAAPKADAVTLLCRWDGVACSAVKMRVAREQGNGAAIQDAIRVLERAPAQDGMVRCELARAYEWSQQLKAAREPMEACAQLEPTPQNHYRLGMLYQKLGLSELAHREMELRNQIQANMSQETAVGMDALRTFKRAVQ
jgi:tetratricopeptide (TPR) repeat protein